MSKFTNLYQILIQPLIQIINLLNSLIILCLMPYALCSIDSQILIQTCLIASCPMSYALCLMPYALCSIDSQTLIQPLIQIIDLLNSIMSYVLCHMPYVLSSIDSQTHRLIDLINCLIDSYYLDSYLDFVNNP